MCMETIIGWNFNYLYDLKYHFLARGLCLRDPKGSFRAGVAFFHLPTLKPVMFKTYAPSVSPSQGTCPRARAWSPWRTVSPRRGCSGDMRSDTVFQKAEPTKTHFSGDISF